MNIEEQIKQRLQIKKILVDNIEFYSPHTKSEQLDQAANALLNLISGYKAASEWEWREITDELQEEQCALFARFPICEPPYCGSMIDDGFPHGYFTHCIPLTNNHFTLPSPQTTSNESEV